MNKISKFSYLKDLLLPGVLFLFTLISAAQSKPEMIEELMEKYSEYQQFNGSVLVAENGNVIYKDGLGLANMEFNIPNEPDTKHRLGSITKQFTAMLVLQLVENGKLELDKPISEYLPEYTGPAADKVTIHHLLTHSSGIPSYNSFPGFFENQSRDPYTPGEFVKTFADSTLQFTPGEKFVYNNSGYFLLGHIIEKVSGKTYEEMLKENIFEPLEMKNSGYDHHAHIIKNRAAGYERVGNGYRNAPYLDMSIPYAAGSLYSTVEDLYLWDRALYEEELLNEKLKEQMFSAQIKDGDSYYGYGWAIRKMPIGKTKDSILTIAHGGGINGFNTLLMRIPEDQHLIVLLNNTGGTNLGEMARSITNILYDTDYEMPKRSIAMEILPVFMNSGVSEGMKKFKTLKADQTYGVKEDEMNMIGYRLLQAGKTEEAITVFKINVEEFPESGNVYDSLGEAYLEAGQKELAIENYKKSVEIDPQNINGINILKKLEQE
ncbi:serine hydrolase [Salegentibacter sediminis]|uniref:serine hydrolase n=1 Tax=Salegentibacter sediminis TaxID=1930251 RepID=UPI0009BF8B38|nr:serine hydrolase [Salegentibacter sediminis]